MKDKTTRNVFAIIIASILFISFYVPLTYYIEHRDLKPTYQTGVETIDEHIEDKGDEQGEGSQDGGEQEPSQEVKAYNNGFSCIRDAFEIVDKSPGLKITSQVTAVTDILGIGSATQYVTEVKTRSGDYFLKETWAHCTVSLGQNFYRCFYSSDNLKTILYKKTSSYNSDNIPNWNYTTINTVTNKEEVLAKYDLICFDMFDFYPNKQNSKLIKFDRTSDKKYYIISFSYDTAYLNPTYIKNMLYEGGLTSIDMSSIAVTYYVEKATLYVRKAEIDQIYSMTKGVTLDVNMHQDLYINSIGKALTPSKPSYV